MNTEATLTRIAEGLNGRLVAYRRITADAYDERYAIVYSFGGGAWTCAVVDARQGTFIDGTSQGDSLTAGNINRALETAQRRAVASDFESHLIETAQDEPEGI